MNEILLSLRELLADSGIQWAVCGGFALDLFLGCETRVHGDLDIAVTEAERGKIEPFMRARGWQVYEFRGQGRLRPLAERTPSELGRNLMCVREGCELVTFWPCDEPGLVLHEWHSKGIQTLNYVEFLFQGEPLFFGRAPDKAVIRVDGIPCLAPEVVLRYKASQPERDANRADFEAAYPRMTREQQSWLLQALPPDHPWAGECWDVYDFRRTLTGHVHRRGDPMRADEYHLVVQVWIRNSRGEWLISRRAPGKSEPLKWEPTGGSVLAGEDSLAGALREAREELGISLRPESGQLFCSARREQPTWANPGFLDVWVFQHDCEIGDLRLQAEETCAARWATESDIRAMIADGRFVPMTDDPYFDDLFRRYAASRAATEMNQKEAFQ